MKVALYARVSRDDLFCENQKIVLRNWLQGKGLTWEQCDYYQDETSSRKTRPNKEAMIQAYRSGKYDTIVVSRLDRYARSLQELIMDIEQIINNGGTFIAVLNGFNFSKSSYNASDQLMLNIFGAFAQFERELIRERTLEGLARVKALGKKLGRPRKTSPVEPHQNHISIDKN